MIARLAGGGLHLPDTGISKHTVRGRTMWPDEGSRDGGKVYRAGGMQGCLARAPGAVWGPVKEHEEGSWTW